jgi:hypothetical protein
MYRYTLLLALCAAMTLGGKAPLAAGAGTDAATLKKIASRIEGRGGVISIEASDPVAYVASQPNPQQFVVELRDVVAIGFADNFKADPRHPFTAVEVETSYAADGARVARVRMSLDQPECGAREMSSSSRRSARPTPRSSQVLRPLRQPRFTLRTRQRCEVKPRSARPLSFRLP